MWDQERAPAVTGMLPSNCDVLVPDGLLLLRAPARVNIDNGLQSLVPFGTASAAGEAPAFLLNGIINARIVTEFYYFCLCILFFSARVFVAV